MKKLLIALIGIFSIIITTAFASTPAIGVSMHNGLYLTGALGYSYMPDNKEYCFDTECYSMSTGFGLLLGLGAGYKQGNFRHEFTLLGTSNFISDDLNSTSGVGAYLYSLYFDFNRPNSNFVPYIGAGIGAAIAIDEFDVPFEGKYEFESDTTFIFQAAAGFNYYFTPHFFTSLEYDYFATPNYTFHLKGFPDYDAFSSHFNTHTLSLKFSYLFF